MRRLFLLYVCAIMLIACGTPTTIQEPAPPPTATQPPPPTATQPPPPTATQPPPPTETAAPELCRERPVASGKAPNSNELQPGGTRLRIARSDEMKHWVVDDTVLLDQAATPSLTLSPDGMPMLYMTAHAVDGKRDGFAVSVGNRDATTWRHCYANLVDFPRWFAGVDPDVVQISAQQYRIFLTGNVAEGQRQLGIHYADSSDGITWTYGGIAFAPTESVIDSMTFRIGDTWHMYVLPMQGIDMIHATSTDGKTFAQVSQAPRRINGQPHVFSQTWVFTEDDAPPSAWVFGFGPRGTGISMAMSQDGETWTDLQSNVNPILSVADGDHLFVKDPAIVYFGRQSGMYQPFLVVYATAIP